MTAPNLLTLEAGGDCEVLETEYELYETSHPHEIGQKEEVIVIGGTITISP